MIEELDGILALNEAVLKGEWSHTMDAKVWTDKFIELFPRYKKDEDLLFAWFCNAIMAGYDQCSIKKE